MKQLILHTLFGNLMKDEKNELNFRCEADEVSDETFNPLYFIW